jgi:hypothetical protein
MLVIEQPHDRDHRFSLPAPTRPRPPAGRATDPAPPTCTSCQVGRRETQPPEVWDKSQRRSLGRPSRAGRDRPRRAVTVKDRRQRMTTFQTLETEQPHSRRRVESLQPQINHGWSTMNLQIGIGESAPASPSQTPAAFFGSCYSQCSLQRGI